MTWEYPDTEKAVARFEANAARVEVSFERKQPSWYVAFTVDGPANEVAYSALAIFAGVFDAVAQFLAVREPQTVVFAADRDDVAEIYRTYLEKDSKKLEKLGYRVDGQHRVLRRFKPSRWAAPVSAS